MLEVWIWFLKYDPDVLRAVAVEAGKLGKNALIESNTVRDGEVIIALADSSGINGDGAVASVAFEVIGDVGTTSYLTLEEVLVHNLDLGEIIPNTVSGTFKAAEEDGATFFHKTLSFRKRSLYKGTHK